MLVLLYLRLNNDGVLIFDSQLLQLYFGLITITCPSNPLFPLLSFYIQYVSLESLCFTTGPKKNLLKDYLDIQSECQYFF